MAEQFLKIEDLKEGEIYVSAEKSPGYIFQVKGDCRSVFYLNGERYGKIGSLDSRTNNSFNYYRYATEQEKKHLLACINADRYVGRPKSEIIENYSIY